MPQDPKMYIPPDVKGSDEYQALLKRKKQPVEVSADEEKTTRNRVPLPTPDPRGPPVATPAPSPRPKKPYSIGEHIEAGARALFEGDRSPRQRKGPGGFYDRADDE